DLLRRRELGGHDQVALVLTVLVVDDHDDLAATDRRDGVLDRRQLAAASVAAHGRYPARSRSTYLDMTSTSRLTRSHGPLRPRVTRSPGCRSPRLVRS